MAHLNKIVRIPDLPDGLKKIASEAAMFFDPGMPLAARIEYLLADDTRVQLLLDWDLVAIRNVLRGWLSEIHI